MDGMIPMGGMDCWFWNTDILLHLGNQPENYSNFHSLSTPCSQSFRILKLLLPMFC